MPKVMAPSITSDLTDLNAAVGVGSAAMELTCGFTVATPGPQWVSSAWVAFGSWEPIHGPEPFSATRKPLQHG